jgi:transcriptional regulator with XRE-family HTH domain
MSDTMETVDTAHALDAERSKHWTERSVEAFYQRMVFDFITQVQKRLEDKPVKQVELAEKLGVTEGRVSQILNNPGDTVSLKKAIKLARAVGMKLALVAYDDNDPDNERGPINSDIFRICWENANRPRTFRHFHQQPTSRPAVKS